MGFLKLKFTLKVKLFSAISKGEYTPLRSTWHNKGQQINRCYFTHNIGLTSPAIITPRFIETKVLLLNTIATDLLPRIFKHFF